MEWIVELFGELLTEVFCGVFVHLSQFFLPDKPISKRGIHPSLLERCQRSDGHDVPFLYSATLLNNSKGVN